MDDTTSGVETDKKVKLQAWSDENENNVASLKTIMRPVLVAMSICGCYNFHNLTNGDSENSGKGLVKRVLSRLYRVTLLIILILYLAKSLVSFFYISKNFILFNGLITGWMGLNLCIFLINLKATSKTYGNQESAFTLWDEKIIKRFSEIGVEYPVKIMIKRGIMLLVIGSVIVVMNMGSVGVQISVTISQETVSFYTAPFEPNWYTLTAFFVIQFVLSTVWFFPVLHAVMVSTVLARAFTVLNTHMHKEFGKNACRIPDGFQKIRLLHMNLSKLVKQLDGDFCWFYANLFVWNIGMACFTLYQIIRTSMDTFTFILYICWLVSALAILGIVAIFAAFVNDAAHAPLDCIYDINVSDITMEKVAQLNLFLSKLTGTQVGFTTCGLLTITKEFILTIAGVFLTYFAVLYTL